MTAVINRNPERPRQAPPPQGRQARIENHPETTWSVEVDYIKVADLAASTIDLGAGDVSGRENEGIKAAGKSVRITRCRKGGMVGGRQVTSEDERGDNSNADGNGNDDDHDNDHDDDDESRFDVGDHKQQAKTQKLPTGGKKEDDGGKGGNGNITASAESGMGQRRIAPRSYNRSVLGSSKVSTRGRTSSQERNGITPRLSATTNKVGCAKVARGASTVCIQGKIGLGRRVSSNAVHVVVAHLIV